MIDPETIGVGAIAAYIGKDGLEKLLGPTAEYIGLGCRDFAKRRIDNIGRIFKNAHEKLGAKIDKPGEVPPRVLKAVLDEGSFCDNEIASEYFGGILASSRTEHGRDDRGARIAKIINNLSTYQIRTHYLIYSEVKKLFSQPGMSLNTDEKRLKMRIFLPITGYIKAMEFSAPELQQFSQILAHVFIGLDSDDLINNKWMIGNADQLKSYLKAEVDGIVCIPSLLGAELFLWAFGQAEHNNDFIFDPRFKPIIKGVSFGVVGAVATCL